MLMLCGTRSTVDTAGRGPTMPEPRGKKAAAKRPADTNAASAKRQHQTLTVKDIVSDKLTMLAAEHWPVGGERKTFDAKLVDDIYNNELAKHEFASARIMLLEFSQYLEKYVVVL